MRKLLLILFVLYAFSLNAEYLSTSNMIDIPTADVIGTLAAIELNGSFSVPLSTSAPDHVYYNMYMTLGVMGKIQTTVNYYTVANWSLDVRYLILKEYLTMPGIAIGISDITYKKFISPIGGDSIGVLSDHDYVNRPFENVSLYLVVTKNFFNMMKLNIGIGRGRYVGYGPVSHNFNPSLFAIDYTAVPGDWYFGVFGGLEMKVIGNYYLNMEFDGRDANAGIRWKSEIAGQGLQAGLSFTHLEQINSSSGNTPSINLSITGKLGI